MIIDTLSIIIGVVLIGLAVVSCLLNPFFLIPLKKKMLGETNFDKAAALGEESYLNNPAALPPISVIVSVNDNISFVERNLPTLLSQDYPAGYQVIVVAAEGDSDADDLIKRYAKERNLKSTFIPDSARYVSREKLGITLGVKAADYEWCVLIDALCRPISVNWLREIGRQCTSNHNLVIGYCNYDNQSKAHYKFNRLRHFAHLWRESENGTAFTSNNSNMALRKSEFIQNYGFRGNLDIVRGEYDFIINKYARKNCTAIVTSEESMLIEEEPTPLQWHRRQLFYIHSAKNMQRSLAHSVMPTLDAIFLHLTTVLSLAAIIVGGINYMTMWPLIAGAVIAMIVLITWRTIQDARAIRYFNAGIKKPRIFLLELSSMWHYFAGQIRYLCANKRDFTCHKI